MSKSPWFLSKEKKDRSNFWKSRSSGYSSSNYWLKDSIFEKKQSQFFDEPETLEKESRHDHFQLAQYQRAISNFVRIMTGRNDIVVRYNSKGENYTDGKTITLSPNIKEKEFDTAVGLALHEASHILHSDFDMLKKIMDENRRDFTYAISERKKLFWNLVEDIYIDATTYRNAPGYRGYYSSLYQKYFGDKKIVEGLHSQDYAVPTWDNYLFHLINIRNPQRNLQALPGLQKMFTMIDLPNITRLSGGMDARLCLANDLYNECEKYIDAVAEMMQQMGKSQQAAGSGEGDGGGSGEISYDQLNEMLEKMGEQMDNEGDEGDEGNEGNGGNEGSEGNGDKFVASNGVNIQEEVEDANYVDMDKLSDKAKSALEKMFAQQKDFVRGVPRKGILSKVEQQKVDAYASVDIEKKVVGTNSNFSKKGLPLYIIKNVTQSFIDSVGTTYGFRNWVSEHNTSNIEDGINRGKMLAKKLQLRNEERVLKTSRLDSGKIDKRLLHEIGFDNFDIFSKININSYKPSFIHISLDQSGSMGGELWQNAIQFAAMFATASKSINNIHLVITTRSSFSSAGKSAYSNGKYDQVPYMMTIFDSKKHGINHIRKFFPCLEANSLTPEGLCFDGIMKETIAMSQNTDAYFINICDGEPYLEYSGNGGAFDYRGTAARKHSREQMKRMESGGIKFITYFIGNSRDFDKVKECYGENAVHLKRASEVHKIATTLNKRLLASA